MKRRFLGFWGKLLVAAAAAGGLSACASGADPGAMTVTSQVTAANAKPFPAALTHAMCVRDVTGGEETNPMWASKVDDASFKTALTGSLDGAGLLSTDTSCAFPLDVNLLGLSQPSIGFDMTVTSHVNYKVFDHNNDPLLLATIDAPFTATVGDAFAGVERLKLANEGSIRTSIGMFFDKLRDTQPK
jgi:hypothetical protein